MRGVKTLWRLALGKNRNREPRKSDAPGVPPGSEPSPRELRELADRLLGAEPPTRILQ